MGRGHGSGISHNARKRARARSRRRRRPLGRRQRLLERVLVDVGAIADAVRALSKARAVLAVDSSSPRVRLRAVDERAHVRGSLEESLRSLTAGVSRRLGARATTTVIGVIVIIVIIVRRVGVPDASPPSSSRARVETRRHRARSRRLARATVDVDDGVADEGTRARMCGDDIAHRRASTMGTRRRTSDARDFARCERRREGARRAREAEAAPEVTFRIRPEDDALARGKLPAATAPATSAIGGNEETGTGAKRLALESNVGDVDPSMLAPRRVNWDLKRDVEPKLEKLERRTRRALVDIAREEDGRAAA